MDSEEIIYSDDTLISQYTNKPINISEIETTATSKLPAIFWCSFCDVKLPNPTKAGFHFSGKSHRGKVRALNNETQSNAKKQKHGLTAETDIAEPVTKKIKTEPGLIQKCEDCDIEFSTEANALSHYKGKKHAKTIKQKHGVAASETTSTKTAVAGPVTKKGKVKGDTSQLGEKQRCEDCDKEFLNAVSALNHFKGQKHTRKVVARMTVKQASGRGGGGRGRGEGQGRGRGRGGYQRNSFIGKSMSDDKLIGAMKDFLAKQSVNKDYSRNFNNEPSVNTDYGHNYNDSTSNCDSYSWNYDTGTNQNYGMNSHNRYETLSNEVTDLQRRSNYYQ